MSTVNVNRVVDASGGVLAPISSVMRNRIINGAMVIDQRNAGASVTPTVSASYQLDRWQVGITVASRFSVQQNAGSVTPPVGFTNYLGCTSLSAYAIGAGDTFRIQQPIEGFNMADLSWGTASAQAVTISFRVYSSLTGTFGGAIYNNSGTRSYPFSYSIPTANTWTTVSITIAGDTTGTWVTNNGVGMYVAFSLGTGSTFSAAAGAWASGFFVSATGATSVVGTNGATFYITGVQLEKGTQATSFEYRQYGQELALCQRYYWASDSIPAGLLFDMNGGGAGHQLVSAIVASIPVTMRATPTITVPAGSFVNVTGSAWSTRGNLITPSGSYTAAGRAFYSTNAAGSVTASIEL